MTALDAPNGAVVAAVAVAFLIMVIGGIVVWVQGGKPQREPGGTGQAPGVVAPPQLAQAPAVPSEAPATAGPPPAPAATAGTAQAPPGQAGPVFYFGSNPTAPPSAPPGGRALPPPTGEAFRPGLPPAQVMFPPRGASAAPPAASTGPAPTVHLPDNGLGASELGAPPVIGTGAEVNPPSTGGRVTLEIEGGGSRAPATGGGGAGTAAGPVRPADLGSDQQLQMARRLQMQGSYRAALRAYIKALDGAGDAAAEIHQQMGLCHQRLDEPESAVTRYNEAIALYKAQIAAGRNVEAAQRGIRACEAGIRVSQ